MRRTRAQTGWWHGEHRGQIVDHWELRSSSGSQRNDRRSAMPVDDPRAVEVIRGELTAHAIAGQDSDSEAAHLARHVPEHHMVVVELYTEHRVGQGLDHLT